MNRILEYKITNEYNNYTVEQFLKSKGFTRNIIVNLKKTHEGICLNNKWAYTIDRLKENDILRLTVEEAHEKSDIVPVELDFEIIYEDEDILIINKPANMPIHPSINNYENTLANALMYYYRNENFVFRCINRLDRDTSGLTIIAKNPLSASILGNQVASRNIHRTYMAICKGKIDDLGTVDAPIARLEESVVIRCVNFDIGEKAVTHYKRISYDSSKDLSLVELELETGRTHQIRVHMKHIGHPLIGDFLYNPDCTYINRQALHSSSLSFIHPITKEKMNFHIPLARDMEFIHKNT